MNRTSLAVTTELRGDRWLGKMAMIDQIARIFNVPLDMLTPLPTWNDNTIAVLATDFTLHGESFYRVKDGDVTHIPHENIRTAPCIGSDPGCPCQDGLVCHYVDYPAEDGWPATKGWVIP